MRLTRRTAALALATAYVATLATSILFLARDSVPPRWDAAAHLLNILDYRALLVQGQWRQFLWRHYAYYPPLVYQLTAAAELVLGGGRAAPWVVLQSFALLLLLGTYRLARAVAGRGPAVLAAVCVLLLPIVTVFTREFALDVPLLGATALVAVLVMRGPFASRRRAAFFGAVLGLGLLVKWAFALAAAGPVAYAAWSALRRAPARTAVLRRLGLALALALALAGPWYGTHLRRLWSDARLNAVDVARAEGDPPLASLASAGFYLRMAADEWLYLPLGLATGTAVVCVLASGGRARVLLSVFVWPAWILFTLVPNKDPRYGLPVLPVLGAVLAAAGERVPAARLRGALAAALCVLLAVQHLGGVAALGLLSARVDLCLPELTARVYDPADPDVYFQLRGAASGSCRSEWTLYNPYSYFGRRPRREDWKVGAVVDALPARARVWLGSRPDVHFNPVLLQYAARRGGDIAWVAAPGEAEAWMWTGSRPAAAPAGLDARTCASFVRPDASLVTVCRRAAE